MASNAEVEVTALEAGVCLDLVRSRRRGRIAVGVSQRPEWFAINYVLDADTVVFCTAEAATLGTNLAPKDVTLQVTGYDIERGSRWRVVLKGCAEEVSTYDVLDAETLMLFPWTPIPKLHFGQFRPTEVVGYRFQDARILRRQQAGNAARSAHNDGGTYSDAVL
jgi:hypothetical protein